MKRTIRELLFAIIAIIGLATFSQAAITGSAHDFSSRPWSNGQICLPCHAPHNGINVANAPLWNHQLSTATYTMYSSPTLDAEVAGQPSGISKLCLSCHDGTVAVDAFGNSQGGSFFISAHSNMGTDLSDDHPISFIYDSALAQVDGGLYDPTVQASGVAGSSGTIDQDMLFAGSMECSSCHEVHNANNFNNLLLKPNGGSGLCLTCHNT